MKPAVSTQTPRDFVHRLGGAAGHAHPRLRPRRVPAGADVVGREEERLGMENGKYSPAAYAPGPRRRLNFIYVSKRHEVLQDAGSEISAGEATAGGLRATAEGLAGVPPVGGGVGQKRRQGGEAGAEAVEILR